MTWLISDRMNIRVDPNELTMAGTPFELKDKAEVERLVENRGFRKLTKAEAEAILYAPEVEEEGEEGIEEG